VPRVESFVGKLAGGKRVYVRRLKGDESESPIVLAVYADVRGGGMTIVARFHDPPHPGDRQHMRCRNGLEHEWSCHWEDTGETMTPAEAARWNRHWWTHVGKHAAEIVELKPVAEHGANLKKYQPK